MSSAAPLQWIAFAQDKCIATGEPEIVAVAVKEHVDLHPTDSVQVFNAASSDTVELDLRGTSAEVLARLPPQLLSLAPASPEEDPPTAAPRAPGRPKLGVTAREVTLLPRHWNWLAAQPGGASTALRKLVELAMRNNQEAERVRLAQEAAYRFMNVMAGDRAGYEEAIRALFAGDLGRLQQAITPWPGDIKMHTLVLAIAAIPKPDGVAQPS